MSVGVYLPNMDVPTRCAECWLMDSEYSWCTACRGRQLYPEYRYGIKERPDWCPLVPVQPHGDLIERQAVLNTFSVHMNRTLHFVTIRDTIPAVIPAEPAEEDK